MSKYLAVCDLDDTLLTGEKRITRTTVDYLRDWVRFENRFCICTGRPYQGAIQFYDMLGLSMPMITDNGCAIYNIDGKNKFFEIPLDIFKEFLTKTKDMDTMIYITTGHNVSFAHHLELVPDWIIHNEDGYLEVKSGNDIAELCDLPPLICNFWVKEDMYPEFEEIIKQYSDEIFYRNWGTTYGEENMVSVEIHSAHASKGLALRYLKEYYQIDEDKTIAFGDQLNDSSMILEASYGVAMINAVQALKELTEYETEYDYNNDGVIRFIRKHELY